MHGSGQVDGHLDWLVVGERSEFQFRHRLPPNRFKDDVPRHDHTHRKAGADGERR